MQYPGDTAEPAAVALWMADTAEKEYGLPGILPVMCSATELTAAWVASGDVRTVEGYLEPQDHNSYGYFQQQAPWWGTPEQLIDADYALRAFCQAAVKFKGKFDPTNPAELGLWCQAVQISAYGDRYLTKGYPIAKELLDAPDPVVAWPELRVAFDSSGWAYDPDSKKLHRSDADLARDVNGWLYAPKIITPPAPIAWKWPEASLAPVAGNYEDRHPTRYTWRPDVEAWARHLVDNYSVWCNTYYDHPEGYWRTADSIDVWGEAGRDDPIDPDLGNTIFSLLFNDPGLPNIEWIIWQRTLYQASNGWYGEPFGTEPFSWHDDHIHITYSP